MYGLPFFLRLGYMTQIRIKTDHKYEADLFFCVTLQGLSSFRQETSQMSVFEGIIVTQKFHKLRLLSGVFTIPSSNQIQRCLT